MTSSSATTSIYEVGVPSAPILTNSPAFAFPTKSTSNFSTFLNTVVAISLQVSMSSRFISIPF